MATADLGHTLTEQELAKLERQIAAVYKEAQEELQKTVAEYFAQFEERDKKMKALIGTIQNGKEWTEADYKQWRLNQIGRGERFEALRDEMAKRYTDANAVAIAYVNDATPGIYSLNRNYAAYTIDKATGGALTMPGGSLDVSWTLFDESTVKRLLLEQPDLMPNYPAKKALERGIDLAYGKKQITSSVTSAILQGKSIKGIADDLQSRISGMERSSAIRTARTAVTGAQNAGRIDSYKAAEKMGIAVKKEWLATLDNRTRHAHAILDGQKRATDDPFEVDGYKIRFPGDPQAKGYLVYNCRCTLIAALDDVDTSGAQRRARDPETGESVLISDMSYSEWAGWQKASISTIKNIAADARDNLKSIDTSAIVKLKSGFSAFPKGTRIAENILAVKPKQGFYDIAMHGCTTAVGFGTENANMSPRLLAAYIRSRSDYDGQSIRLLSCNTGNSPEGDYCFAEELSNALGVAVEAPNDELIINSNGKLKVGIAGDGLFTIFMPNQRQRIKRKGDGL